MASSSSIILIIRIGQSEMEPWAVKRIARLDVY